MISLILQTATRYLVPLLFLFSVFLLLAGHNEPGGGFVGGLVASAGFALYAIAFDVKEARRVLTADPIRLIGVGLGIAIFSGLIGLFASEEFFYGVWTPEESNLPKFGTPGLFDVGVYLVVIGVTLSIVFTLAEGEE